jgi:GT2 family glycosyltransferase
MIDASSPAGTPALAGPDGPDRPAVDVVVPFLGSRDELRELRARLAALRLRPADSVTVVDNTPGGGEAGPGPVPVLSAARRQTPGYARNRGAAQGRAPWIVFLDADTLAAPDLLDRYFEPPPAEHTALLGGGVVDEPVGPDARPAVRYAHLRGAMSQGDTFAFGAWGYPKSANVACRRSAFEAVGGFREDIRAGEDADLTYRLRDAGLGVERREAAAVVHRSRDTVRGLLRQKAMWGAGGAWLARTYPGSVPLVHNRGLAWWAARETIRGLGRALIRRDRDAAILAVLHPLDALAWQFGRWRSNHR